MCPVSIPVIFRTTLTLERAVQTIRSVADPRLPCKPPRAIMKLIVTLDRDESGMIVAECPAIPGCVSQGATEDEALANVRDAIRLCLQSRAAHGMPLTVTTREVEVAL